MKFNVFAAAIALSMLGSVTISATANAAVIESFETGAYGAAWVEGNASGFGTVSTSIAHDGSFGVSDGNSAWVYRTDAAATIADGDILSAWVYNGGADGRFYLGFGASAAGASSFVIGPNTDELRFQDNAGYEFITTDTVPFTFTVGEWYLATVTFSGSSIVGNLYGSNGTTLLGSLTATGLADPIGGGVAVRSFGSVGFDTISLGAVPEPASWMMLIAGFGLVGAAMRRRQVTVAA
jgi:hypothetical protein